MHTFWIFLILKMYFICSHILQSRKAVFPVTEFLVYEKDHKLISRSVKSKALWLGTKRSPVTSLTKSLPRCVANLWTRFDVRNHKHTLAIDDCTHAITVKWISLKWLPTNIVPNVLFFINRCLQFVHTNWACALVKRCLSGLGHPSGFL